MKPKTKWISMIIAVLTTTWLAACTEGTREHQPHQPHQESQRLTISFQTDPAQVLAGKKVTLTSSVKAGTQPINEAKVEFEVWKKEQKNHQMIAALAVGNGLYKASTSFREKGGFLTIVHVTTPQVHQMISRSFRVGQAEEKHHSHDSRLHHGDELAMHILLPPSARSGKSAPLTAHVQREGSPFTGGEVQFEYWREGDQKHEYIDTSERKPGEYYTTIRFPKPGTYHVKLHVEKGETHAHKEETLAVK